MDEKLVTNYTLDTVFSLRTKPTKKHGDFDGVAFRVPEGWDLTNDTAIGELVTSMVHKLCGSVGRKLHSADLHLTDDRADLRKYSGDCSCPRCVAALDQCEALMENNPGMIVMVGIIHYLP